jgi:hypothetical protein
VWVNCQYVYFNLCCSVYVCVIVLWCLYWCKTAATGWKPNCSKKQQQQQFLASAAILKRSALFWGVTQRVMVILYRRFGTTYLSHLQGSRFLDPWRWDRYVFPKRRCRFIIRCCVIPQKSADILDFRSSVPTWLIYPQKQNDLLRGNEIKTRFQLLGLLRKPTA